MNIQIIVYNGFDELDAIAPYEVLKAAANSGIDLQVELVTLDNTATVTAQHGLPIGTTGSFDESADLFVVPGGGWNARTPQGARAEAERGTIPAALARLHENGKTLASVCTGAMLLATAGLLTGRHAVTHHAAIDELRAMGAHVINARVVDDGDIISAGGVTSGLDLALWLLERYYGPALTVTGENRLEYQRRGTVWRRPDEYNR